VVHLDVQQPVGECLACVTVDGFVLDKISQAIIKAMEAVCHGEHLQDLERVKDRFEDRIDRLQKALESQQTKTEMTEQAIRDEVAAKLQQEDAQRKSEHAKKTEPPAPS